MHFNWDMVVPVLFQLYICLAVLNRMRFLNREIFLSLPLKQNVFLLHWNTNLSLDLMRQLLHETCSSLDFGRLQNIQSSGETDILKEKGGKKKKKKRRKWAGICSLNCPSTRRKLITQRGTHGTCRSAHCVLSIFLGVLGRMKEEEGKTRQQIYFPRKCISFGWFFKLYFVGPLSKGIYEGAHAKESSVDLGTEKAQKVEKPV